MASDSEYTENNIRYLDPREHVRKRPGMYIGSGDKRALHNLIAVMLDHVVEQAYLGQCNRVQIELHEGNTVVVSNNGPGLPSDQYRDENNFKELEALRPYRRMLRHDLKPKGHWMSTGMDHVGFWAVNALSEYFEVENYHEGVVWRQKYQYGLPITDLVGIRDAKSASKTGTRFVFRPDYSILDYNDFDKMIVEQYADDIAKLFPGVTVEFRDTRTDPMHEITFQHPEGLKTYIERRNQGNEVFHEVVYLRRNVEFSPVHYNHTVMAEIEVAVQFSDNVDAVQEGYANTVRTSGVHIDALKSAMLSCINQYMNTQEEYPGNPDFTWDEISTGLSAVVSVYYIDFNFTHGNLYHVVNPELFGPIAGLIFEGFSHKRYWAKSKRMDRIIRYHLSRR